MSVGPGDPVARRSNGARGVVASPVIDGEVTVRFGSGTTCRIPLDDLTAAPDPDPAKALTERAVGGPIEIK